MAIGAEDDTQPTVSAGSARPPSRRRTIRLIWRLVAVVVGVSIVLGLGAVATFVIIAQDLPEIRSLNDYHPKQATVVYGKDGQVVARFASERRTVVPFDRIPKVMVDAVIAAEDDQFFTHEGVDYLGILRCAVKNAVSGRAVCGGSTITQQTVKTFLLTPEKKLSRKLKEIILAKRVEEALSKNDILYLYMNQIYYGHGAYGVQEAAKVYLGKDVDHLTVEEAALLAGLPQSPNRLDPYKHPERALKRRGYVLARMLEIGKLDRAAYDRAVTAPIRVDWRAAEADLDNSNHYAAHIRKLLEEWYGPDKALDGGLRVYVGIDPGWQRSAEKAVRDGVRDLDKRQGWRGPLAHLEPDEAVRLTESLSARLATVAPSMAELEGQAYQPIIWDLSKAEVKREGGHLDVTALAEEARFRRLELEMIVAGVVSSLDEAAKVAQVELGPGVRVDLSVKGGLAWARKHSLARLTPRPQRVADVLQKGDVVLVRPTAFGKPDPSGKPIEITGVLEQEPVAQAALVAIDPATRQVRALVGGYGVGAGTFNRATQASRQAGSTFKPFVYGAAIDQGFRTIDTCLDRPHVDAESGARKAWKPQNYDGHFDGEITLRTALTKSKNLCSVWVLTELKRRHLLEVADAAKDDWAQKNPVVALARQAGVTSPLPGDSDALALGAANVFPLEMVNAYATLASGGRLADPVFIQKVVDANGRVIYEVDAAPEPDQSPRPTESPEAVGALRKARQTIRPELNYLITSLMQSVVDDGTARPVAALKLADLGEAPPDLKKKGQKVRTSSVVVRDIAGKTGTTNESRDAWFIGFTPNFVAGVWVGFDNNDPLGPGETGGRAAIPMWIDFARDALKSLPPAEFEVPPKVVQVWVDPSSGKLVAPGQAGAVLEPFVVGTEPTDFATEAKPPVNFGLDDLER